MKNINFKRKDICVKDIPVGECFMYCGDLYMAIDGYEDFRCVNLATGLIYGPDHVDWDTIVTPVDVDINVK